MRNLILVFLGKMKKIDNLNEWIRGKTVMKIENDTFDSTTFIFADGTAMLMEIKYLGHIVYGPVYYEINYDLPVYE